MGNYGIRISVEGQDVKSCSDLDTIVNSKYANLKGTLSGYGTATVGVDGTTDITVTHSLGYIPFATVYSKIPLDNRFWVNPTFADGALYGIASYHWATTTTLVMRFQQIGGVGNINFNYKYFIYLDKGKLT